MRRRHHMTKAEQWFWSAVIILGAIGAAMHPGP
jgi:hypothetical protein